LVSCRTRSHASIIYFHYYYDYFLTPFALTLQQNFGHVTLPETVQVPRPVNIGRLSDSVYGVSSGNITVIDSSTIVVESFTCNCQHTGS